MSEKTQSKLYPLQEGEPDALVIHCSDPRFQTAFRSFVKNELNVQTPMVIALPGTTSAIGLQGPMPKKWYVLRDFIATMTARHAVGRVILINHDECRGYAKVADLLGGIVKVPDAQKAHLKLLAAYIRERHLPGASFELYQAHIVVQDGGRKVQFERIV